MAQSLNGLPAPPDYKRGFACIDGEFVPAAEATVSIFDHSFLYGDGVFESMVCRRGRPFALEPHLDRLWASCAYLQIAPPFSRQEIEAQIAELLERNELTEGYVRVVISRGEGYPVSDPRKATRATVIISVQRNPAVVRPQGVGIKLAIASTRRIPAICLEPRVKSNNYLNHIVAKLEAIAAGADDALMLDIHGNVAELPVANLFAVRGSTVCTPPSTGILAGITRRMVIDLLHTSAVTVDLEVAERTMSPYDLFIADEVFVVGTGTGVVHVESIDGRLVGNGTSGPVTTEVRAAYDRLLDGDLVPEQL